jgi:carboxylesterase
MNMGVSVMMSEPLFVSGSSTGCLLLHGLSGNPADLRPLADTLVARGYTVSVPLLPGHGPTPEGAGRATTRDWTAAVAREHDALFQSCTQVVLAGHSMGGLLAIAEATRRSPAGLVLLGVPTFVGDWRTRLLPIARHIVRWWYPLANADFSDPSVRERMLEQAPAIDLDDPAVQQQIRRSVRIPTYAIDQFMRLMRRTRPLIRSVSAPTLVVHGRQDSTALPICADEIYRDLQSSRKELVWFDAAGHQLITGGEGAAIIDIVARWIDELASDHISGHEPGCARPMLCYT